MLRGRFSGVWREQSKRKQRAGRRTARLSGERLEPRLMLAADLRDLLIADPLTDSILRFDGTTGAPLGAFVGAGSGGLVDPHDPTFGPDGNLYAFSTGVGAQKILRFDGSSGAFLDTFVDTGEGGFGGGSQMAFGPDGHLYVATATAAGIFRFDGSTGDPLGAAASGNGIRRACGVAFGFDGGLYVLDADAFVTTLADRVLRFDPDSGDLLDEFVPPGRLDDPCLINFGPDGHLYVHDLQFGDARRFSGATGELLNIYPPGTPLAESPAFEVVFGPDGNAYAPTAERILRYDGETGRFQDVFVEGFGGSIAFFPPDGPPSDLAVVDLQVPPGAVQGKDVSIAYTVQNNSPDPTPVQDWVDRIYLSKDLIFDPYDQEIGRIERTGGLSGGGSYTQTLVANLSDTSLGDYHVLVFSDRLGQVPDLDRANNIRFSGDPLELLPPLSPSHDPQHSIAVGRTLSAYTTADVFGDELTMTYTVYNLLPAPVSGVLLTTTLQPDVTLEDASRPADRDGRELVWSLGTLGAYESASVEVTVARGGSNPLQLDGGPAAFAFVDGAGVSDDLAPAVLRTDAIDPALLAATVDANSADSFVLAKAAELNQNAWEIFAYVRDEVDFESYAGSLRGSRGALWSSAGNALDQASLLVALLRASGIPARYAEGLLADPETRQLIQSMFPASVQAVGLIPDGTSLADPANDPDLHAEIRDHYWAQFDSGTGFQDADPAFAGAVIGQTFTTLDGAFSEVPFELQHLVTVRLDRELAIPASALFSGNPLHVSTALDVTFTSAELVGRPLTIGHFVQNNTLVTPVFTAISNNYSPYLAFGDEGLPLEQTELIRGVDFQEFITNFPLGSQVLTGLFLEMELTDPSGGSEIHRRTLADRIGFDIRQNGGVPNLLIGPDSPPLVTEADAFTLFAVPGLSNPRRSGALPEELQTIFDRLSELPPDDPTGQTGHLERIAAHGLTRLLGDTLLQVSDAQTAQLAEATLVRAYSDQPRLVLVSSRSNLDVPGAESFEFSIDLRRNTIRAVPFPGQNPDVTVAFQATRGLLENANEESVVSLLGPGAATPARAVGTLRVLDEASTQGIELVAITQGTLALVSTLDISAEAKARITNSITPEKLIVVPARMVDVDGRPAIAWLDMNVLTGETIGVTEDGGHQAIAEFAATKYFGQVQDLLINTAKGLLLGVVSGQFLGISAKLCQISESPGNSCAAFIAKHKEATIALAEKIAKLADDVKYPGFDIDSFKTAFRGTVQIIAKVDPPVPNVLVNPLPQLPLPENVGANDVTLAASIPAGAVSGTVDAPHTQLSGQLQVNWTSGTNVALSLTTLSAAIGTVRDGNGTLVGTGLVSLDATTPAAVSGSVTYDVTGRGALSSYAAATGGLGISGQWDSYAALLSGSVAIEVETDALVLNGVPLPGGSYTIETASASVTGGGSSTAPNFLGSVTVGIAEGTVLVGPGNPNLSVGGVPLDTSQGLALSGFAGTATITADATEDSLALAGSAEEVLRLSGIPDTLSTDQNTPATFAIQLETSLSGSYTLQAEAPAGWIVEVDATGTVKVSLPPGLQAGEFPIRLSAQSLTDPRLVAHAQVAVTVDATPPGVTLDVDFDPLLYVPFAGSQVPTAYQATIHNSGPAADTFELTFPVVPLGFEILVSSTTVTIPAGETAVVGLYLNPVGSLPDPGTDAPFTVSATSATDAAITDTQVVPFTVPEIHGLILLSDPPEVSTIPGVAGQTVLVVEARGNVIENVTFSLVAAAGLTVDGLQPLTLDPGELTVLFLTLTPDAGTPLNSTLSATITAEFGAPETVSLQIPVQVAAPGVASVFEAAGFVRDFLNNIDLANRLDDLGIALTNLAQELASEVFQSQAVASLDSILSLLAVDPVLVNFADDLQGPRDDLAAAVSEAEVLAALLSVGAALDGFADAVFFYAEFNFELFLLPNTQVAQPQVPIVYELKIHHIGGVSDGTYNIALSGLPPTVLGELSDMQVTLARDEFASVFVTLMQTADEELLAFDFRVDVSVDAFPEIAKSASGSLTVRDEFVTVVSVAADPPFAEAGGVIDVSARVLNAVNRAQQARASFVVKDSGGVQIGDASEPVDVTLSVQASLVTVDLGSVDTTGLAEGTYYVEVSLADLNDQAILGATGTGSFLVGLPVNASIDVAPDSLPPGTNTVTHTLEIEATAFPLSPPLLVGQAAVAGATDVVRNGDFVYVAGAAGISVFNIAGANLDNPQLVRVVGSATNLLKLRGDLLVAVRFGASAKLDTYSLAADPANPQSLGTTGNIPYGSAADVVVTDTHAFVVIVNLHFNLSNDIVAQNGGVLAINIANPAAPFLDGDATSAAGTPAGRDGLNDGVLFNLNGSNNGTNNDGINVILGIDQSGGNQMTWSAVQVSPAILLVVGSSATGTDTQTGVGLVRVVDISDPRNMTLIRDLPIPGTVHIFDIAVDGNRALVTGSQGGIAEFTPDFPFTGNVVQATLDLADPANPLIIDNEQLGRAARGIDHNVALGGGVFAFSSLGTVGDQPGLFVVAGRNPDNFVGIDVPAGIVGLSADEDLIFTADGSSLIIYRVPPVEPLTLVGQEPIAGARGVAVRDDVAYVSSTGGIHVVDVSDPQDPAVIRTLAGNHFGARIQDNVLLAMRPSGSAFILDVYAIHTDPQNPVLLGSSPAINYNLQVDLQSNSTHAFVVQTQACLFLGSLDLFHQAGDLLSIALNLNDPANPASAAPALDSVLFNTFGDATPGQPGDISGCPRNGGEHNVWKVELPDAQTALLATTTSTGTFTQVGMGRIQVVDIANPAAPSVVRGLDIPGTVHVIGLGVEGDVGVAIGSTGGWNDPFNPGVLLGNLTITTLDLTDARDPQIVTSRTLDRPAATFWANSATLGNNLFAFSNLGFDGIQGNPAVLLIDASNPRNPVVVEADIPLELTPPNSITSAGGFLFTSDAAGLSIYEIGDIPAIPITVQVQVPNGTGVEVVGGSFNMPPTEIITGPDFDTLVWDLTLTPGAPLETLTWSTLVTDLQVGQSRTVTLDTTIDFGFQGTPGQVLLPPQNVFAEHILTLDPSSLTLPPGDVAVFQVGLANPTDSPITYDLAVVGLPPLWVDFPDQVLVGPHATEFLDLVLSTDPFVPPGDYSFVITATAGGVNDSVEGTVVLEGDPVLPAADPVAHGVVVEVEPLTGTAGPGTAARYTVRVTNTGSAVDTFFLDTTLPAGFFPMLSANFFDVPPGAGNYREVVLIVEATTDQLPELYGGTVTASSVLDLDVQDDAPFFVSVANIGVDVTVAPSFASPQSTFQMTVTNTGQVAETFDLSLAGPASLVSSLAATSVTLDPNASIVIPVDVGAIDFAQIGTLSLVAIATSRTNAAIQDGAEVLVAIEHTRGLDVEIQPDAVELPQPGPADGLILIDNLGNLEDAYQAMIVTTTGPITARLIGLDGQPTRSIPSFRLPGLASGTVLLETELLGAGQGTVTVQVSSLFDPTMTTEVVFVVNAQGNAPPTVDAGGPYSVPEGGTVVLIGSATDPDGTPQQLIYAWDLDGDGMFGETGADATRGEETGAMPAFDAAGLDGFPGSTFIVTLRVTDGGGDSAEDTATINIQNAPPVPDAGGPYTVLEGGTVALSGSATDPGGAADPLTFAWDLDGDGIFGETGAVAVRGDETGPAPTFNAAGLAPGMITVALRLTDDEGEAGEDTAQITIEPARLVVQQLIVNGGAAQRSNAEKIEILVLGNYDVQSLIDSGQILDVVEIHRVGAGGGEVALLPAASRFAWDASAKRLTIDLTLDGFGGSRKTQLADASYQLRLTDAVFADTDGLLDGLYRFDFHRLEGDFDGNRRVDLLDRYEFLLHYGSRVGQAKYDFAFDLIGDGVINSADYKKWATLVGHAV